MRKLLCSSAAVLGLFLLIAPTAGAAQRCNGQQALCARTFDQVVLPAAHNAMSAADQGFQFPNQRIGIAEQLQLGIRGFLIDVYYGHTTPDGTVEEDKVRTPESSLYLCHLVCRNGATPLATALGDLNAYVTKHPDTVLELDLEDYVSPADFAAVAEASGLTEHVYRGNTKTWPTLAKMIATNQQVVVLAEKADGGPLVPWYHAAYNGILQETGYTYEKPADLTTASKWRATCAPNRGGTTGSLFLMNHWAPPFGPKAATSRKVNAADVIVGRAVACGKRRGLLPTTIAADMVDAGGLISAVARLNRLGSSALGRQRPTRVAAKVSGRDPILPYGFVVTGRIGLPPGVARSEGCRGRVAVTFKSGKNTISTRRYAVSKRCAYRAQVSFGLKDRLGRSGTLKVTVRFTGNAALSPRSSKVLTAHFGFR
jgi:hypothetical protein